MSLQGAASEETAALETTDCNRWGNFRLSGKWSHQWHDRLHILDGTSQSYIDVSDKNANRFPDCHRLDVSVSKKFESDQWQTEIGVSVFNLYNHKNIW